MRIFTLFFAAIFFLMTLSGCVGLLVGGVAAGAGTAVWLSDKLTQQFDVSYDRVITAGKKALAKLKLEVIKETREGDTTQLRSKYKDGKDIWIDIHKITEHSTKVEVRVGVVSPDKAACEEILKTMKLYL